MEKELDEYNSYGEDSARRLPCKRCNYCDDETGKCVIGNEPKVDNDPIKGCWDYLP